MGLIVLNTLSVHLPLVLYVDKSFHNLTYLKEDEHSHCVSGQGRFIVSISCRFFPYFSHQFLLKISVKWVFLTVGCLEKLFGFFGL